MNDLNPTEVKPESKKSKRGGKRKGAGRKPKGMLSNRADSKLTVKQKMFIAEKLKGASNTQAALTAGYSPATAVAAGRNILDNKNVRSEFQRLFDQVVPNEKLVQRIGEGLDAEHTEFAKSEGKITDQVNTIAWSERRAYAELACKIKQVIPKDEAGEREPLQVVIKVLGMASINVVQGEE